MLRSEISWLVAEKRLVQTTNGYKNPNLVTVTLIAPSDTPTALTLKPLKLDRMLDVIMAGFNYFII
jgi:hypothetical protein